MYIYIERERYRYIHMSGHQPAHRQDQPLDELRAHPDGRRNKRHMVTIIYK